MKNYTNNELCDMMISYFSGGFSGVDFEQFGAKEKEVREIFAQACRDWDKLECDPEGFTEEQNKVADKLLDDAANEVLSILK